jgi:uncharacterized transporter YbjL
MKRGLADGTRVRSGLVGEGLRWVVVVVVVVVVVILGAWRLLRLCFESTYIYHVLYCGSDRFNVQYPRLGVGWRSFSQVEG